MKKLVLFLAVCTAMFSCSNEKKVRAKLIGIDGKTSTAIYLINVDPMYRTGDTTYIRMNKYIIVK
jgi:hypothetical protein